MAQNQKQQSSSHQAVQPNTANSTNEPSFIESVERAITEVATTYASGIIAEWLSRQKRDIAVLVAAMYAPDAVVRQKHITDLIRQSICKANISSDQREFIIPEDAMLAVKLISDGFCRLYLNSMEARNQLPMIDTSDIIKELTSRCDFLLVSYMPKINHSALRTSIHGGPLFWGAMLPQIVQDNAMQLPSVLREDDVGNEDSKHG